MPKKKRNIARKGYGSGIKTVIRLPKVAIITSFRANGEIGAGFTKSPTALQSKEKAREAYFRKLVKGIPFLPDAPGAWFSVEALGQVNWPGERDIEIIIKMLNDVLNLRDKNKKLYDFRKVYPNWRYKYQLFRREETETEIIREIYYRQRQRQVNGRKGKIIKSTRIMREITDRKTQKKRVVYD